MSDLRASSSHFLKFAEENEDTSVLEYLLSDENKARPHAYAALEELFYLVLEHRWINPNPNCMYAHSHY